MNPISDSSLIPYPYLSLWICFPVINTINLAKKKCRNANSGLLNGEHPENFGMKFSLPTFFEVTTNVNYDGKIDAAQQKNFALVRKRCAHIIELGQHLCKSVCYSWHSRWKFVQIFSFRCGEYSLNKHKYICISIESSIYNDLSARSLYWIHMLTTSTFIQRQYMSHYSNLLLSIHVYVFKDLNLFGWERKICQWRSTIADNKIDG